ncbi:MAG: ECF-type sigma factor [Planctomycetota bacterium]
MDDAPQIAFDPQTRATVTRELLRARRGETDGETLAQLLYADLHRAAGALLRRERRDHTLQATALVHEAWLRLVDTAELRGDDATAARRQFVGLAVSSMRRILVEHARARLRDKRGGGRGKEPLPDDLAAGQEDPSELLDLDAALDALAERRPRAAKIAELRIYGGLSVAEAAAAVDVALTTAKGEWALAQALLGRSLRGRTTDG